MNFYENLLVDVGDWDLARVEEIVSCGKRVEGR